MSCITLPSQLTCENVLRHAGAFMSISEPPGQIAFDFSDTRFARPDGIVLLHNLTRFLHRSGWDVRYSGFNQFTEANKFLDDIGFFEDQIGRKVWAASRLRPTTCRLQEVRNDEIFGWIDNRFIHWVAQCSGRPVGALASLKTCVSELFNNIRDHTQIEVGSIFAQWFPNIQSLEIAIGDFGGGIPANVLMAEPNLPPGMAIVKAFEEGFSTKGNPKNRGAGLNFLRATVAEQLKGHITVYSGGGCASNVGSQMAPLNVGLGNLGYTGTLIRLIVPTGLIADFEPEAVDEIW